MSLRVGPPKHQGIASNPPGATFGPRTMRDFEFVWIIDGDCVYRRDGVEHAAGPGAMVLCRPGAIDAFDWDPHRRSMHGFVHFDVLAVPSHWPSRTHWPDVRTLPEGDVMRPMLGHLLRWSADGDAELTRMTLRHLLSVFVLGELSTRQPPSPHLPAPVQAALEFVEASLREDPTRTIALDDMADAAHVTPGHLCRLFKSGTGHTPAETVRLMRLDAAAAMLARSNEPIQAIAQAVGFASPFHFSRRFREAFGLSPSAYRRSAQTGVPPPLPMRHSRHTLGEFQA
ncbi:MAG: helix-turn-helix transcriptional regulator [Planctomycetota bacterium]